MFDHPSNPGFPGYWHARGYGLFTVNNLGKKAYDPSETESVLVLDKAESVEFRHMLLIRTGQAIATDEMNELSNEFKSLAGYAEIK
jgi:hypothetical protein